jgi:hypothetical protein
MEKLTLALQVARENRVEREERRSRRLEALELCERYHARCPQKYLGCLEDRVAEV